MVMPQNATEYQLFLQMIQSDFITRSHLSLSQTHTKKRSKQATKGLVCDWVGCVARDGRVNISRVAVYEKPVCIHRWQRVSCPVPPCL